MCELFTIGATAATATSAASAGIAITVMDVVALAGTAMGTMSSMRQAQTKKDQMAYQAKVDENKAIVRERQAVDALKRGEEEKRRVLAGGRSVHDRALVTMAGQGGDVTTGSNVDLLAEIKEGVALDASKTLNNAERKANSIRVDASNATANSIAAQHASDATNPLLSGVTTALAGLGKVGAQWYKRTA
tara:strand:+ start:29303 stop:29869 length:567 start_codon:yes stop_codon:yes gene_type:complete